VIYRAPQIARAAFAHEAEYTRIIGEEADEAFAFWDYGPELSRRFRALKIWMLLKGVGLHSLGEAIDRARARLRTRVLKRSKTLRTPSSSISRSALPNCSRDS